MSGLIQQTKIGACERWRNWASVLAGRGASVRRRDPLELRLLRRQRNWLITRHHHAHSTMNLRAEMQFAIASNITQQFYPQNFVRRPESPAFRFVQAAPPFAARRQEAGAGERRAIVSAGGPDTSPQTQSLMRLIVDRTQRIEERVMRRELVVARAASAPVASDKVLPHNNRGQEWWQQASEPGAQRQASRAAVQGMNVEQITENVLRQLDRRVGAWRERMGRM
jgi:hypothetical protein